MYEEIIPVSGLMLLNIINFLELGGFENTLTKLFYLSITLWIISIIVGIWKTSSSVQESKPETDIEKSKQNKRPKTTRNHKNRSSRK
jgi:preprotein translocase subunit SecG